MKRILSAFFLFAVLAQVFSNENPGDSKKEVTKEQVSSIILSCDAYKNYEVLPGDTEIILKSKKLEKNKYNQDSYPRIFISEGHYENGELTDSTEVWYQKRKVRIGEESVVPATPTIRIFYRTKFITVTIPADQVFDFDFLCSHLTSALTGYEMISINKAGAKLKWIKK